MKLIRYIDTGLNSTQVYLHLEEYEVIRETPKGYWIVPYVGWQAGDRAKLRFVLKGSGKRYAYPDDESAWKSFQRRKQSQLQHLRNQLQHVEFVLENLERLRAEFSLNKERQYEVFETSVLPFVPMAAGGQELGAGPAGRRDDPAVRPAV